jgi:hypothetical protein
MEMVNHNTFKANPPDTKVSAGKTDPVRPEFRADPDLHLSTCPYLFSQACANFPHDPVIMILEHATSRSGFTDIENLREGFFRLDQEIGFFTWIVTAPDFATDLPTTL